MRVAKKLALGAVTVGLASCLVPAASAATPAGGSCKTSHVAGWYMGCTSALSGWRYLTLNVTSGSGFAEVVCTNGNGARTTVSGVPVPYLAGGTCDMEAGGTGSGSASD